MLRFQFVLLVALAVSGTRIALCQDADDVKILQTRITLLELQLKKAEREIERLKKELAAANGGKSSSPREKSGEPDSSSPEAEKEFPVGSLWVGSMNGAFYQPDSSLPVGESTRVELEVKSRKGTSFVAGLWDIDRKEKMEDIKGSVDRGTLKFTLYSRVYAGRLEKGVFEATCKQGRYKGNLKLKQFEPFEP